MSCRPLFVLLALTIAPSLAACGDDEPTQSASSVLQLNGTYRPTEPGPIGSVTFANGKDYSLVPAGCESSECSDVGTYRIDAATSTILLENARTHRTKTITLEDVKTVSAERALVVQGLSTRDSLVNTNSPTTTTGNETTTTGNQTTTTGNETTTTGNETTTTDNDLTKDENKLLDVVASAAMNGQAVQRDQ